MPLRNLDLDALRTLVLAEDLGGFGLAAEQLGRTPSAISLQMKRLQDEVEVPLFRRVGRKTALTEQGEIALHYARRLLALNDEMLDTLRGASLSGLVRIGFAQDFVETVLPEALSRFHSLYPHVRLEVKVDRNVILEGELEAGRLDLALTLGEPKDPASKRLGELPLCWIAAPTFAISAEEPLPLVLLEQPCLFRTRALDALDSAGRSWRVAMTSPSVSGLWAAVGAGLGLTVRVQPGVAAGLNLAPGAMPPLGTVGVILRRGSLAKAAYMVRLEEIVEERAVSLYKLHARAGR